MPEQFVAIDVHQGDAFYLELHGEAPFKVLVDGGRNYIEDFVDQFRRAVPHTTELDLMVCTHWDDDHVLGLLNFLKSDLTTRELWVPDDWYDQIGSFLEDSERCFHQLLEEMEGPSPQELKEIDKERRIEPGHPIPFRPINWFDEIASETAHTSEPATSRAEVVRASEVFQWFFDQMTFQGYTPDVGLFLFESHVFLHRSRLHWGATRIQVALNVLHLLASASSLVDAALKKGVLVRWFAFDPQNPGGPPVPLKPLNCREVRQTQGVMPTSPVSTGLGLLHLALTPANQNSLVFYAPGTEDRPNVLFSADSNFDFMPAYPHPFPWQTGMLITTPHHGAASNGRLALEYTHQVNQHNVRDTVWVRSDTDKTRRPADWFTSLPSAIRYCTRCRLQRHAQVSPHPSQVVTLLPAGGRWTPAPGTMLAVWRA